MTATSGPGMSLKTEILGLATIAELPLVLVNVQRGGPSTGLPTKPEQGDLYQAAFSGHGDVLRPMLAPTDVEDTFRITVEAFNIAEQYQTPVIILSDQEIAQRKEAVDLIDTSKMEIIERRRPTAEELVDYSRFKLTESGISPISQPGMKGGNYLGSGIEHNEKGDPTSSGTMHAKMNAKRFKKLDPLKKRADLFETHGDPNAPFALVAWGSTAGRVPRSVRAGEGGQPRRQAAGALPAVPDRRAGLRRLLRLGEARPGGRAVPPGPAVPDAAHVHRRAPRDEVVPPRRRQPVSAGGDRHPAHRAQGDAVMTAPVALQAKARPKPKRRGAI